MRRRHGAATGPSSGQWSTGACGCPSHAPLTHAGTSELENQFTGKLTKPRNTLEVGTIKLAQGEDRKKLATNAATKGPTRPHLPHHAGMRPPHETDMAASSLTQRNFAQHRQPTLRLSHAQSAPTSDAGSYTCLATLPRQRTEKTIIYRAPDPVNLSSSSLRGSKLLKNVTWISSCTHACTIH